MNADLFRVRKRGFQECKPAKSIVIGAATFGPLLSCRNVNGRLQLQLLDRGFSGGCHLLLDVWGQLKGTTLEIVGICGWYAGIKWS